ncbi:MAG: hypothetical protein NTV46_19615 [Verrucomicrobia bacterium]|nr:hypothetical protein [Verrucomicrobiota bacterium]
MESARLWDGYVCPDCRFVFRVQREYDGQGVVCPSCRRMLKIPSAGDHVPPLLMPQRPSPMKAPPSHPGAQPSGDRRHTKKSRHSKQYLWEGLSGHASRFGLGEKRQMFWLLIVGTLLLILIVAGVLLAMFGGKAPAPPVAAAALGKPAVLSIQPETPLPTDTRRTDAAFLAEAEPLTSKFLEACRIEDLLPLVRNPSVAEARMRRHYPAGKIAAPGMEAFNTASEIFRAGTISILKIRTRSHDELALAYVETPQGIKIDWESWVGWSDMSWEQFITLKPTTGQVFRLVLCPTDYYNFAFANDNKWQAYRLTSPDGGHLLYGYAERGSVMNSKLRPSLENQQIPMMLALKFPDNATSDNQVLIEKIAAEGWVLASDPPP